jgi:hypothetical protein
MTRMVMAHVAVSIALGTAISCGPSDPVSRVRSGARSAHRHGLREISRETAVRRVVASAASMMRDDDVFSLTAAPFSPVASEAVSGDIYTWIAADGVQEVAPALPSPGSGTCPAPRERTARPGGTRWLLGIPGGSVTDLGVRMTERHWPESVRLLSDQRYVIFGRRCGTTLALTHGAEGVFTLASDGTLDVLGERAITPAAAAILELGTVQALADALVRARREAGRKDRPHR